MTKEKILKGQDNVHSVEKNAERIHNGLGAKAKLHEERAKRSTEIDARGDKKKRGTSDGYMVSGKAKKIPPYPMKGGKFIDRLEKHKEIGSSLDNGNWKPRYKGQSFEDAIDEHKTHDQGEFA